jgi:hypothetical protein
VSGRRVPRPKERRDPDAWLFLTPEIEREVPPLLDALDEGARAVEANRIEQLVHRGSIRSWFAYLREVRGRLEHAARRGGDPLLTRRLADVLKEQYLLVPALRPEEPDDGAELARLEELTWIST